MKKANVIELFKRFQKRNPEPVTELEYTNHFTLLVAVVLSAQATDKGVNKATPKLFALADNPSDMAALGEEKIRDCIKTIGLFNSKAANVYKLSIICRDQHDNDIPRDFKSLNALPGVGRKTANVVLNCAFGEPTIAVDTHIFRLANRLGLCKTKTADATEDKLKKVVPDAFKLHAHHWLILHGRYICKARRPECERCFLTDICPSNQYKPNTQST